jgi:hypothetical protein
MGLWYTVSNVQAGANVGLDTSNDVLMEIEAFEPPPMSGLSKLDVSYSLSTGNREKGIYTAFNYI